MLINLTIKKKYQLFSVSKDAVKTVFSCLNTNKAAGMDQIPLKLL